MSASPDSKVYGANMGPTWGRQDPGGPYVGPMDLAIWVGLSPGLASKGRQSIMCANNDYVLHRHMASPVNNELTR